MKRIISLILCTVLILCGCSSVSETVLETSAATELAAPTELIPPVSVSETLPTYPSNPTISETVVFDNGDFKLTAKEIDFSDNYAVKVKMLAENNTDKHVSILGNYFSINGITMYCSFYIELAPGKKANDFIKIRKDDLVYFGIEEIATIQAHDTYIYDKDISKKITDFQFNIETSIATGYHQSIDNSGQTVYDQHGIVIKYRGIIPGTFGGEELEFFIENKSDVNLNVHVDNVSVNGFMVYGSMVGHAYPGCVTYETLDFSKSDLEDNDIDSIDVVEFSLYGFDNEAIKKVWETGTISIERNSVVNHTLDDPNVTPEESPIPETSAIDGSTTNDLYFGSLLEETSDSEEEYTFILNTNTRKFHFPSCSSTSRIKESNKSIFTGTRDEVISKGYKACNNCNP